MTESRMAIHAAASPGRLQVRGYDSAVGWADIVRTVRRHFGSDDAEDHVQEAFIRLLEQPGSRPVRNAGGFLRRVAGRLAISAHRQARRRALILSDPAVMDRLSPTALDPEEILCSRQRLMAVETAIGMLPERARVVFLCHRVDGLSYTEIALRLGVSISAVEKNMARALTQLTLKVQGFERKAHVRQGKPERDR